MPTLPTFDVTSRQAQRLLAAFDNAAGYKTWLKGALRDEVIRRESRAADQAHFVAKRAAEATLESEVFTGELAPPEPDVSDPELVEVVEGGGDKA